MSLVAALLAVLTLAKPLPNAHAHNDYMHPRPLLDALDHGFCSVEADIFRVGDELLVAHERATLKPERTLRRLYLDPLRQRVRANGGRVYPDGPSLLLLIDIKEAGEAVYALLKPMLREYREMLTEVRNGKVREGAVTVVISGDCPRAAILADPVRYAAIDGRLSDLDSPLPAHAMPLISDSWFAKFRWLGIGPMPEEERARLRAFVERAHAAGRRVRFWSTPHSEALWTELLAAGVDLLNADDLGRLKRFLNAPQATRDHALGQPLDSILGYFAAYPVRALHWAQMARCVDDVVPSLGLGFG